ncbi:MAG: hypothetical protein EGR16_10075 [Clostridiales bacterium]|nr:hypothetical protein [Clostridiales bacterium]
MKFKEYPKTTSLSDNDAFIVDGDGGTKHILAKDSLATKVDKVEGKGLSTNDFTKDYKSKLDALNQNLSNKASCSSVLMTIVPNEPFTPKTDYHPATKKYVDDSVKAVGSLSNLATTEKTSIVAAINELKAAIDALKGS